MQVRLARIHVRRHNADTSNSQRDLRAALASFYEALKFRRVESQAVHYLEITSVYLKLNETQKAANALSTILVRWPSLLVNPLPEGNTEKKEEEEDHAEVDLPVAGTILGGESVCLQMGLCYERLGRTKMALGAFRQAWNALLEQRDRDLKRNADNRGKDVRVMEARRDNIGIILQQARAALGIKISDNGLGNEEEGASDSEGKPAVTSVPPSNTSEGKSTPAEGENRRPSLVDRSLSGSERDRSPARGENGGGVPKKEIAAADEAAQMLGFELWMKEPYTWFAFGEMLLKGGCFALSLTFLDKATGLLPPGLQQQEKGRFSDAYSAAAEAKDLEPFGREVRLLCPRLMALHSKDAGYQYTRESLSAARIQRVWREYHVVHALRQLVRKQIAAMRIQRFMRDWTRCNHGMAIQLVTAGAMELGRMRSAYARGMGLAAQAAAVGRHGALIGSALSAQRAGRALIARRKATRRREAITILQAFFRGCRERVALSAALEERCRSSWPGDTSSCYKGSICSGMHEESQVFGIESTGGGRARLHLESDEKFPTQVGIMSRRNVPMDAGCPAGFDMPNLAAFLWEHDWGEGHPFRAETTPVQPSQLNGGACIEDSYDDAIFELSARAFVSATENGEHEDRRHVSSSNHDDRRSVIGGETQPLPSVLRSSRLALWLPVAVAPEKSLARALEGSTLIINSPSFRSVCARRLFSRIGRPTLPSSARAPHSASEATNNGAHKTAYDSTISTEGGGGTRTIRPSRLQGDRLTHILVSGDSPMGDGGLLELGSVIRRGLLPRLVTLIFGGRGCRVGPRGLTALATALSSARCAPRLRTLSMSNCCLGQQSRHQRSSSSTPRPPALSRLATNASTATVRAAAHAAWDCLFRHLQRMTALLSLTLQDCGLDDGDMRPVSIAVQILPAGRLRCLRLNGNSISVKGLQVLLRALTSRKIRLPALWLRQQRPALVESEAREVVKQAFSEGLFAEVEFERPRQVAGGRSQLALLERTTESQDLGSRARRHPTSHIYV
ncbi:unnamed protein product [Laminaria digitata]